MTHTPTPWTIHQETMPHGMKPRIHDIGHTTLIAVVGNSVVENQDQWDANAAFIVRACNAHDELVAALHAVNVLYGDGFADDIQALVRAALSKAEGR